MAEERYYEELYAKVKAFLGQNTGDYEAAKDLYNVLVNWAQEGSKEPYKRVSEVLKMESEAMLSYAREKQYEKADMYKPLIYNTLKFSAPVSFDHYMQALEYNRPPAQRFYMPRREVLYNDVMAMQALADDELDELFLSKPPRTGKTQLTTLFVTWLIARDSEKSNLYVSYSDPLTQSFYNGILEIITDKDTYNWQDIFPDSKIADKNAKFETLNIDRAKKYSSLTCRSLYGTLNGSCDSNGVIIADDLLSGIEEAINPARLTTAWNTVENNMLTRSANGKAKILWMGTRWSLQDPIGRRLTLLKTDPKFESVRYKEINIPALNEKDESNFMFKYGLGFTTDYYLQRRASFEKNNDLASWSAQYQGEPIEREGTLFEPDGFMYYNGQLPDKTPDRIFMAVDPAFGGGDFLSAPIIYQYGEEFYVHDVVFSSGEKNVTQPLIASKARANKVQHIRFEATKATKPYVEGVAKELDDIKYHCTITTKAAPNNSTKEQRIFSKAPDIRQYFIFRDASHRRKDYNMFMQQVFSYKIAGRNAHDDAVDSLAQAADMAFMTFDSKVEIMKRLF